MMNSKKTMIIVAVVVVLLEALMLWRNWRWCSFGLLVIFSVYSFICAWKRTSKKEQDEPDELEEKKIRIWPCVLIGIFMEIVIAIAIGSAIAIFGIPSFIIWIAIGGCAGIIACIVVVKIVKKKRNEPVPTPEEMEEARIRARDIASVKEAMKKGRI